VNKLSIGWFISPHGYGHAARSCAIMDALSEQQPEIQFEIFTTIPEHFFSSALQAQYRYHSAQTDIGFVQQSPTVLDLGKTLGQLNDFMPFSPERVDQLATTLTQSKCQAVICDIAPIGITVAQQLGIPSLLIANFTWDWIYQSLTTEKPEFKPIISQFETLFAAATHTVFTEPHCHQPEQTELLAAPIARKHRETAAQVKASLGITDKLPVVLVTMGGMSDRYPFIEKMEQQSRALFILTGTSESKRQGNLIQISNDTPVYLPDIVYLSDLVVAKLGYSIIAETYHADVPMLYVPRELLRESPVLESYVEKQLAATKLPEDEFYRGDWIEQISQYIQPTTQDSKSITKENGADQIATFVLSKLTTTQSE